MTRAEFAAVARRHGRVRERRTGLVAVPMVEAVEGGARCGLVDEEGWWRPVAPEACDPVPAGLPETITLPVRTGRRRPT